MSHLIRSVCVGARHLSLAAALAVVAVLGLAGALAPSALASVTYNLSGTWTTYATGGGYSGTFTVSQMDMSTGKFSGIGDGFLDLEGTESGSSVTFTQSTGGYVATDTATLTPTSTGLEMTDGSWSDGSSGGTFYATLAAQPLSATAVSCAAGTTSSAPLNCTVTVSDASGSSTPTVPTGAVALSSNDGTLGAASCTLTGATTSSATCVTTFAPPAGVGVTAAVPVITAAYGGDGTIATSTGTQTISCTSGLIVQLSGITSTQPSTNGYRVGEPATLQGCGLDATTTVRFGDDDATATPAAGGVAADGTSVTVTVPDLAITGPVSITDTANAAAGTVTLAAPNPVTIDSWRNTNGLSFNNYAGTLSLHNLETEFPDSDLTLDHSTVLRPWVQAFLGAQQTAITKGVCFGMALVSARVAAGNLSPSLLSPSANTAFDLTQTPLVEDVLADSWLAQYSDQALPYKQAARTMTSQSDVIAALQNAMGGPDGFTQPAIIGFHDTYQAADGTNHWEGHAMVAYGYELDSDGTLLIKTADSNIPFTSSEYSDTTDVTHKNALAYSWLHVFTNGSWTAPKEMMRGADGNLEIYPLSAFTHGVTLSRATVTGNPTFVTFGGLDNVESVTDAAGTSLPLDQDSDDLQIEPVISSAGRVTTSSDRATGWSGIDGLEISGAHSTVTLNAGTQPIQGLWQSNGADATLRATSGHIAASFDPASSTMTLAPAAHEAAPKSATVAITDKLNGDAAERLLTVTGPADVDVSLTKHGTAVIASPRGGHFTVSLSTLSTAAAAQSTDLGSMTVPAGGSVKLIPASWTTLATATTRATITHHGHAIHLTLHNRHTAPAATVSGATVTAGVLRIKLAVPALIAGESSVTVAATVGHGAKVTGTAVTSAHAHRETLSLKLATAAATGSRVSVAVTTVNGGTTPSQEQTTYRTRVK